MSNLTPPRAMGGAVVTDAGITLAGAPDGPLVLSVDGRYVWSFSPVRDGRPTRAGTLVAWPPVLRRFLHGSARIRVSDVVGDRVLVDEEVVLGEGRGRIEVVDPQGLPLSVDKVGHLCRAFSATDEGIREEILTGTGRAIDDLREACGVEAYLNYGALLGAVRDGAMIAHDSDTDICYLSRQVSPAELILESYRIERALRGLGWNVLRMSGGDIKLLLPLGDGRQCHIDVFVAFHVAGTFYQLGNRSGRLPESAIVPFSTVTLHGHVFPAPADPEAMLEFVYGPGWRVPDPSFAYADPVAGVRRLDGWLRGFRTDMGRWTEFYRGPDVERVGRPGSAFARWVHRQLPRGAAVADLGAGTGRDSLHFARHGRPVVAYEFTRAARGTIRRRATHQGLAVDVRMLLLGELRTVLAAGAELSRDPRHLYARQLLGCLDDAARANLWLLSRMALRGNQRLFLEFSALDPATELRVGPAALADPGPAGLVRRLDPELVRREIEAAGGRIDLEELGPGVDMLGDPDPLVCRLRVAWPRPTTERNPR